MTEDKKPKLEVVEGGMTDEWLNSPERSRMLAIARANGLPESVVDMKIFVGDEFPQSEASKQADEIIDHFGDLMRQLGLPTT